MIEPVAAILLALGLKRRVCLCQLPPRRAARLLHYRLGLHDRAEARARTLELRANAAQCFRQFGPGFDGTET